MAAETMKENMEDFTAEARHESGVRRAQAETQELPEGKGKSQEAPAIKKVTKKSGTAKKTAAKRASRKSGTAPA